MGFADRLAAAVDRFGPVCVGLDPHLDRLPAALVAGADPGTDAGRAALAEGVATFCLGALEAIDGTIGVVKPQVAFFEALGPAGVAVLQRVVRDARARGIVVLLDAKRGDIGSTARAYARATLDPDGPLAADALTLSPYLGPESLAPFLAEADRGAGLFVLVRTSNPGAGPWQAEGAPPVAERIAGWISQQNATRLGASGYGPVGAVVAATLGEESSQWRERLSTSWLLVPGYGAQGASADDCRAHFDRRGHGALIASSRGVLYAPSPDGGSWQAGIRERAVSFRDDVARVVGG